MITCVTTDFGNTPDAGTPDWFNAVKAAGYSGFGTTITRWASTEYWDQCGVYLDRALTAGLWVCVYCRPPEGWEAGLAGLGTMAAQLRFFTLDVEPEPVGTHPVTDYQVQGLVKAGQRPVIYAYAGEFSHAMGYDPGVAFAQVPLWDRGLRSKVPNGMGQQPLVAFNGWNGKWTRRKVWQWADPAVIAGVACTLNVVDGRWL